MSNRADEMKAKAKRLTTPVEPVPSAAVTPVVRAKPVRTTLDLSPDLHTRFTRWCTDNAADLGLARLAGVDVVRVLLQRLLTDENLQRAVMDDLRLLTATRS